MILEVYTNIMWRNMARQHPAWCVCWGDWLQPPCLSAGRRHIHPTSTPGQLPAFCRISKAINTGEQATCFTKLPHLPTGMHVSLHVHTLRSFREGGNLRLGVMPLDKMAGGGPIRILQLRDIKINREGSDLGFLSSGRVLIHCVVPWNCLQ